MSRKVDLSAREIAYLLWLVCKDEPTSPVAQAIQDALDTKLRDETGPDESTYFERVLGLDPEPVKLVHLPDWYCYVGDVGNLICMPAKLDGTPNEDFINEGLHDRVSLPGGKSFAICEHFAQACGEALGGEDSESLKVCFGLDEYAECTSPCPHASPVVKRAQDVRPQVHNASTLPAPSEESARRCSCGSTEGVDPPGLATEAICTRCRRIALLSQSVRHQGRKYAVGKSGGRVADVDIVQFARLYVLSTEDIERLSRIEVGDDPERHVFTGSGESFHIWRTS